MSPPAGPAPELPGLVPIEAIGAGSTADVFLYRRSTSDRIVAVKVGRRRSRPQAAGGVRAAGRDGPRRSAGADSLTALPAHPHIVAVHATGTAPDGRPYAVMDHYPGPHLEERARRGELAVADVLRVGVHLASALETAHRAGVVHGDVRPANVLVSADHRVGLTDFAPAVLATGGVDRTGGSVATDVYGLCAMLHVLLAGQPPVTVRGEVPRLTGVDVPSGLRDLVAGGLDADPARRPASALVVAEALRAIERGRNLEPTPLDVRRPQASGRPGPAVPPGAVIPPAGPPDTGLGAIAGPPAAAPEPGAAPPPPTGAVTGPQWAAFPPPPPAPAPATTGEPPDARRRRAGIGVAVLVALVPVLGAAYVVASRPDSPALNTSATAVDDTTSTSIRTTTTAVPMGESTVPETVGVPETEPGPVDPGIGAPSTVPGPGATRPPATTRPTTTVTRAPPAPPPTTARPPDPGALCTADGACAGRASWTTSNRRLEVCDRSSDGFVVVAEYRRSSASGTDSMEIRGAGTCNDDQLNMRSGDTITFRACLQRENSRNLERCSPWATGRA